MRHPPIATDDEIYFAVGEFLRLTEKKPNLFAELRKQIMRLGSSLHPKAARARLRLGRLLVQRYRRQTRTEGAIDWQKFRQWLAAHLTEVKWVQLIVSILSLLLLF